MLNKIKEEIDKYNNIILSAHVNPDGDAFGALFAFKFMIEKYNPSKNVDIVVQYELPKFIKKFEESKLLKSEYDENNVELVIMLDTANIERAAINNEIFKIAKNTINIDHHVSNTKYLNINYVEDISSASELLYKFLEIFDIELDSQIAKFMYLGIINDTGNFRHSNVTKDTFYISSKLMETGINNREISSILFSRSVGKAKIFGKALQEFKYIDDIEFAYFILTKSEMDNLGLTDDETDGISELLAGIEDVEVSMFVRQDENLNWKGSFRSKNVDVNKLASNFNGGGHKLAAGFRFKGEINDILDKVINKLRGDENA